MFLGFAWSSGASSTGRSQGGGKPDGLGSEGCPRASPEESSCTFCSQDSRGGSLAVPRHRRQTAETSPAERISRPDQLESVEYVREQIRLVSRDGLCPVARRRRPPLGRTPPRFGCSILSSSR